MTEPLFAPADAARLALCCLDLTSLKDDDNEASIDALAERARTPHGAPAALCVHARFVPAARRALASRGLGATRIATVVNFPRGDAEPAATVREIEAALGDGADEIDAVLDWRALQAGDERRAAAGIAACRRACGGTLLKVILETGELTAPALIRRASEIALAEGADFLKTSTGKVKVNATPDAVAVMLEAIAAHGTRVGLKVAGGLGSLDDVQRYLALAARVYGAAQLNPRTLRFGASSLLPVLLAAIDGNAGTAAPGSY